MQLLAGALLERPPGPKYTAELRFAELALQSPLPKPATLEKWRRALPDELQIALRAPQSTWNGPAGPLRAGAALDEGLRWTAEAAEALEASFVVVATGAAITTGARDRQRLRDYFGALTTAATCAIVWRPTGLWEPAVVQSMAVSLSIIGGFDPIDDPVPSSDLVYGSLVAEGLRRSFSHAQLLDVLDALHSSAVERAFISIDSPQSFREARLLQSLSEGLE